MTKLINHPRKYNQKIKIRKILYKYPVYRAKNRIKNTIILCMWKTKKRRSIKI